jgi:hypothetical protein
MTRTSGGRLAAAIIVGLAVLPLSGCLYAQIPEHPPTDQDPITTDEPIDEPTDEPADGFPSSMSFDDGADVPSTAYIEWADGFFADDGWKITKPDDGNGGWAYGTIDDVCIAQFWQGDISSLPLVDGDDSASSDAVLAYVLGDSTTAADITPLAGTVQLGYGAGGAPSLDARQVVGADDGRDWYITARAFTATGYGVYLITDCTGGDIAATFSEIVEKNPVVITP